MKFKTVAVFVSFNVLLPLADEGTDLKTAYDLYSESNIYWAMTVLFWVFLPSIIAACRSTYYVFSEKSESLEVETIRSSRLLTFKWLRSRVSRRNRKYYPSKVARRIHYRLNFVFTTVGIYKC